MLFSIAAVFCRSVVIVVIPPAVSPSEEDVENSNRNSVNGENNDVLLPLLLRWKGRKLVDILVVVDEAEDDVGGQVKNAAVVVAI